MSDFKIPHPVEQALAGRALVLAAQNISESMEKFVHWMLAGIGVGLTYLLAHPSIPSVDLRTAGKLFLIAAIFGVVQRYLAMIVSSGSKIFQEAAKLPDNKTPVDIARFFIIYIDSLPLINRWAAAWSARRFMKGDLTATGRGLLKVAIIQSILGFVCSVLLLRIFWIVIRSV